MSRYYDRDERDEREQFEREREIDLQIIWGCPVCDFEYEAPRHTNEAMACARCGQRCVQKGESYAA